MSDKVSRVNLLNALESASAGLSPKDLIEQSSCFVFRKGWVYTFNDEVSCRARTPLAKEVVGAVPGKPLLDLLRKLEDDELEVTPSDGELRFRGGRWRAGVRMESEITLPLELVDRPDGWLDLHEDFVDAVKMVGRCAGKDESQFRFTCVHLHPRFVEACDNFQVTRYKIETGVRESVLVRRNAIKHVADLSPTEFAETDNWLHLRNPSGTVISCRRYVEEYPDLTEFLKFKGTPTPLPKGLAQASEFAGIFSQENADDDQITVNLTPGRVTVKGEGASGWAQQSAKVRYTGKEMTFRVSPKLLIDLVERHNEAEVGEERLKVNGGRWVFLTCLTKPGKNGSEAEEASAEGE